MGAGIVLITSAARFLEQKIACRVLSRNFNHLNLSRAKNSDALSQIACRRHAHTPSANTAAKGE